MGYVASGCRRRPAWRRRTAGGEKAITDDRDQTAAPATGSCDRTTSRFAAERSPGIAIRCGTSTTRTTWASSIRQPGTCYWRSGYRTQMAARDHIGLADFSRSRQYIGALPGALATRVQRNCMRIKCMHAECEGTCHCVAFRSFCGPIMDLTVDAEISDGSRAP